jgi:hypothetical protein
MVQAVLQFLFQLHTVHPQISVYHSYHYLNHFGAVVLECCDDIFSHWVGPCVRCDATICLNVLGNVRCSQTLGTHGTWSWHLLLFLHDGKGQGLDEFPVILYMIVPGIGGRPDTGG